MKPSKEKYLEAITKIVRFSPAPRVLGKAMALLSDPNSDVNEIAALIKTDPALTADIIRGANSAFYGAGTRVSSLDHAVQKIGFKESIRLLGLAVTHLLSARDLGSYGIAADDFWAESLFNGLFMEELARTTQGADLDTAHTAGLLRFIGRLAINQSIKDLGGGLFWNGLMPLDAWENENVGFSQTHAGALLLRSWNFAEDTIQAVEWQNQPDSVVSPNWLTLAMNFASSVVPQGMGLAFAALATEYVVPSVSITPFVSRYGLTAEGTREILDKTRRSFISISSKLYDY
jgi:HD-like signal output (HDOD) protein